MFWKNAHTQWQQCWKIGSVPVPISIPTLRDDSKWQLKKGKRQIFLRSNQNWYINNDDNNNNNGHQQIEVEWREKKTHTAMAPNLQIIFVWKEWRIQIQIMTITETMRSTITPLPANDTHRSNWWRKANSKYHKWGLVTETPH